MQVKYPDITVKLVGTDGNVFALSGRVHAALRKANVEDSGKFMREVVLSESYDEALQCMMRWVNVE